jgi:hypothetical protein
MRKAVREEVKYGSDWIKILVTGTRFSFLFLFFFFDEIVYDVLLFLIGTFLGSGDNPNNTMYSSEEIEIAVREAASLGVPVMAHAHGTAGIKMAIKAGVRSIEHGMQK